MEFPAASLFWGMPLVGTFLGALPRLPALWLARALGRRPFVTVELHGIDLVDVHDDGMEDLARLQPGLTSPWQQRRDTFQTIFGPLVQRAAALTMAEHCQAADSVLGCSR